MSKFRLLPLDTTPVENSYSWELISGNDGIQKETGLIELPFHGFMPSNELLEYIFSENEAFKEDPIVIDNDILLLKFTTRIVCLKLIDNDWKVINPSEVVRLKMVD